MKNPSAEQKQRWNRTRRARRRAIVNSYKDVPCMDCGNRYPPECMDFDHVRGDKLFNIGMSIINTNLDTIVEEISKCDVVCANCHRIRTGIRERGSDMNEYMEIPIGDTR